MAKDLQTCEGYYGSRLAIQYRGQPKAQATIQLLTKQAMGDLMIQDVQDAWDLATAVGPQLDTLGKYIGLSRNVSVTLTRTYFGFVLDDGSSTNTNGFQDDNAGPVPIFSVGGDNFNTYASGLLANPNGGIGWYGSGIASVPESMGHDNFDSYASGLLANPNGGTGWTGSGIASVPN